ncbi:MAG: OmpA family protein [Rhodocyclaceae bacterium]|nr:OmpA family protein [Rhodocyclaceae bacterium]
MRKNYVLFFLASLALTACGGKSDAPAPAASSSAAASASAASAAAANPAPLEDMVAFASGALVVQEPDAESVHAASWLLRGHYETEQNWEVQGAATNQAIVIELPERSLLKQLEFDTAMVVGGSAKDISVEVSDTSAKDGFAKIADVSLQDRVDNQTFPASAEVPGRWVRLNIKNGHAPDYLGLNRFRALGKRLSTTPFPNVSGTYMTRNGEMHIRQEGSSVVGCYQHHAGTLEGGIEGRVMKLTWHEKGQEHDQGSAFMTFSGDGQKSAGLFSYKGEDPNVGRFWTGVKRSGDVGTCPNWVGGIEQQMAKDLEESGRVRLYGINFDSDSDHLKDESRSTLDHVAAILKAHPQWTITIEGHTDSTAGAEHNQDLSERRANSVKQYLTQAGAAGDHLKTAGFGASRPLAENATALGRAQNRRVELAKQ